MMEDKGRLREKRAAMVLEEAMLVERKSFWLQERKAVEAAAMAIAKSQSLFVSYTLQ